mmetsp:Transcript_16130/g.23919  ORF Transcript_16130/g.23919 Transcript_16130/m.23919 type:complete len:104 (+) Transcript_16130:601-912(+)
MPKVTEKKSSLTSPTIKKRTYSRSYSPSPSSDFVEVYELSLIQKKEERDQDRKALIQAFTAVAKAFAPVVAKAFAPNEENNEENNNNNNNKKPCLNDNKKHTM